MERQLSRTLPEDCLPTRWDRDEHDRQLKRGEYNLAACRVLDADHAAIDEDPDDPTGTCRVCGYADGWRRDNSFAAASFLHYTMARIEEVEDWVDEATAERNG